MLNALLNLDAGRFVVTAIVVVIAYWFVTRKKRRVKSEPNTGLKPVGDVPLELATRFEAASLYFNGVADQADTTLALQLYGLFKCVNRGQCSASSEPSRLDMEGHAKWTAWMEATRQRLTTAEAMQKYIETVEKRWPGSGQGGAAAPPQSELDGILDGLERPKKQAPQGMGLSVSTMQALEADADTERDLFFYAGEGDIASVERLLEANADVAQQFDDGATALHIACERGHHELASKLLGRHLPGVDITDEDGQTPLHYAIDNNQMRCATILLAHKADWRLKDSGGKTPLDDASEAQKQQLAPFLG